MDVDHRNAFQLINLSEERIRRPGSWQNALHNVARHLGWLHGQQLPVVFLAVQCLGSMLVAGYLLVEFSSVKFAKMRYEMLRDIPCHVPQEMDIIDTYIAIVVMGHSRIS